MVYWLVLIPHFVAHLLVIRVNGHPLLADRTGNDLSSLKAKKKMKICLAKSTTHDKDTKSIYFDVKFGDVS